MKYKKFEFGHGRSGLRRVLISKSYDPHDWIEDHLDYCWGAMFKGASDAPDVETAHAESDIDPTEVAAPVPTHPGLESLSFGDEWDHEWELDAPAPSPSWSLEALMLSGLEPSANLQWDLASPAPCRRRSLESIILPSQERTSEEASDCQRALNEDSVTEDLQELEQTTSSADPTFHVIQNANENVITRKPDSVAAAAATSGPATNTSEHGHHDRSEPSVAASRQSLSFGGFNLLCTGKIGDFGLTGELVSITTEEEQCVVTDNGKAFSPLSTATSEALTSGAFTCILKAEPDGREKFQLASITTKEGQTEPVPEGHALHQETRATSQAQAGDCEQFHPASTTHNEEQTEPVPRKREETPVAIQPPLPAIPKKSSWVTKRKKITKIVPAVLDLAVLFPQVVKLKSAVSTTVTTLKSDGSTAPSQKSTLTPETSNTDSPPNPKKVDPVMPADAELESSPTRTKAVRPTPQPISEAEKRKAKNNRRAGKRKAEKKAKTA